MRTKGLGWGLWLCGGGGGGASPNEENSTRVGAGVWGGGEGGGGTQAVGVGGPAGGPCGVLYGKNQR